LQLRASVRLHGASPWPPMNLHIKLLVAANVSLHRTSRWPLLDFDTLSAERGIFTFCGSPFGRARTRSVATSETVSRKVGCTGEAHLQTNTSFIRPFEMADYFY